MTDKSTDQLLLNTLLKQNHKEAYNYEKNLAIFCFAMLLFFALPTAYISASAAEPQTQSRISTTITQLENGDSIVVELMTPVNDNVVSTYATTKSTSGSKTIKYRNSKGSVLWSFTLSANFSHNGSSATCTSVSTSNQVNDTAWKLSNITKSKSSNMAKGSVTAKERCLGIPIKTVTENLQLKCSANGTLS